MNSLRWPLADAPDAPARLFDEPIFDREPGRGEFRGLEFLHVRARSIINRVPGPARFGFAYSINAYRGCSHACTYCLWGETPVLMGDGRTKRLADVRAGDRVYGTVQVGDYRRYVVTTVLDHWATRKPAYRICLEDGSELIASGDHRFLSDRGWKHVTGAEQGSDRRPHLTVNSRLLGTGGFVTPPEEDCDYRRGYVCGMVRGDGHLQSASDDTEAIERALRFQSDLGVDRGEIIDWPGDPSPQWSKGFLAGIFDAEGSHSRGILRISNGDNEIVERVVSACAALGLRTITERHPARVAYVRLLGGLPERLKFFQLTGPAIIRKLSIEGVALKCQAPRRVRSIEALGLDLPMCDITTGTGDFVANGVISHNCFARPTHAYLDLGIDEDFERKIVVKVNAVERLRVELDPRRWAGDLIAMGTNTDPYQRCEGKYRLTQGIVEALSARANPFSILTKSTLVLRDLDLLAEAARRTKVRIALSIGTLDEEVWRTTEPGTPHPVQRMKAVERLNAAGVPCGVFVAPILPGLSDRPEQIEAVVRAAERAGASSIGTTTLHLRPGVKEVFLDHLSEIHPDLLPFYRRLYPAGRTYAPKAEQQRITEIVRRSRSRSGRRSPSRDRPEGRRPVGSPTPTQLPLL